MGGRPQGARREQNYPTPEECVQLTLKVYELTDPRRRDPVALHCKCWNWLNGNLTPEPVTDVEGVRRRWER